jgi:hypothetical protein
MRTAPHLPQVKSAEWRRLPFKPEIALWRLGRLVADVRCSFASYQEAKSPGSATVSLTTSQRNWRHIFRSPPASLCLKTMILLGWNATTKSVPSRLIDTCLRRDTKSLRKDSTVSSTDIRYPTDISPSVSQETSLSKEAMSFDVSRRIFNRRQPSGKCDVWALRRLFCHSIAATCQLLD